MSDHAWVQEHIAAYLAGGLDAREAERLEAHARECPACGSALADSRRLDDCLSNLFVGVHPAPELEDRALSRLRTATPRRPVFNQPAKWAVAVAAVLLLGVVGAVAGFLESGEGLGTRRYAAPTSPPAGREEQAEAARSGAAQAQEQALLAREQAADESGWSHKNPVGVVTNDSIGQPSASNTDATALFTNGYTTHNGSLYNRGGFGGGGFQGGGFGGVGTGPIFDPTAGRPGASAPPFNPTTVRPALPDAPEPSQPKPDPDKPGAAKPDPKPAPADPKNADPSPEPVRRIILRSGDMEFEIESFDSATATVTKLVLGIKGAFVATVNSDKLTNGKVKGSITVRVPPDQLDGLVLDLRRELGKGGELKGVKLASQDVTKMYTDLESRLRAARTMETRLLQIIKEGKGEIKQLLEAEKELGVWRTKIEETEGELRYYSNLAAFSTLTIVLSEKEIRAAAAITERERVQAGVEVEDVDKAYQQVLAAVVEVKGRITKSELKQLAAGQFNATFNFEVAAESGGPMRDRLRMLGRVARLEIDRSVQTEGGTLPSDAKAKRGDTVFLVQLYNLANVAPRETATLQVAATDVPTAYQALRDAVAKTTGRVLVSQLNEQDRQNISAQLDFEVRRAEEGAARAAVDAAGEVLSRQVGRAAETDSVTDSKVLYRVLLLSAGRLKPREVVTLSVEVADVDGSATLFAAQVAEAKGRQVDAKLDRDAQGQATAKLVFEVPLAAAAGLVDRFKAAGTVRVSQSVRDPQATDGRYATARIHVTLTNVEAIVPDGTGLWPKVRQGLTISASVLLTSVTWVVFGLCVVLPWAVIGFGGYRVVRRIVQPAPAAATPEPPAPPPASA